jgi:hypothetical protein
MAPFSNIDHAVYYDDIEEDIVSLDGKDNSFSSAASSTHVRKSSISSCSKSTVSMNSHGSSSSTTSSVSFATEVAVFTILHINDYSLTERRDSWYDSEEMRQVRQEWKSVVQVMERSSIHNNNNNINVVDDNDESSICVRGLEGKTYSGKQRRRQARSASLEVVLNEQWYQGSDRDEGSDTDPVMIAIAYHDLTYPMQVEAYKKAERDAQVVGHSMSMENDNKPRKFDFRSVRTKYFGNDHNHDSNYTIHTKDVDSDATMACTCTSMTCDVHHNAHNLLLHASRTDCLRKRLSSCFLPLTPKRYARGRHTSSDTSTPIIL